MNLLFFLTPKSEVLYVDSHDTVRQVMERMEYHTYQAIPMIDSYGHYVGTITEGDILWWIKDDLPFDMKKAETDRGYSAQTGKSAGEHPVGYGRPYVQGGEPELCPGGGRQGYFYRHYHAKRYHSVSGSAETTGRCR